MPPNLTKSDLETPRHASDLYDWVRRIHGEFGKTAEGRNAVRLRRKPGTKWFSLEIKRFLEEIWPLAIYAKKYFGDRYDVSFKPVVGNQSHDALLVDDKSGATQLYFEITQALDDEAGNQEHLRQELVVQQGHAPLAGPPLTRDRGGVVQKQDDGSLGRDWEAKTICLIRRAIRKKAEGSFPRNTVLIVEYNDDWLPLTQEVFKKKLESEAKSGFCCLTSAFSEFVLIASSGDFCERYGNQ